MKVNYCFLALFFSAVLSLFPAGGARIPEDRVDATHVVEGVVSGVYKNEGEKYTRFVVRIRIEKAEKGAGLKAGDFFYAECFQRKLHKGLGLPEPGASGHSGVPKEGERIRVFVNEEKGVFEGVYPEWYDVLPKKGG